MGFLWKKTKWSPWYGKQGVQLLYHMFVALLYFAAIYGYYDLPCRVPTRDTPENYAGFWKFLTYWDIMAQFLFFAFSCITDSMEPNGRHRIAYNRMIKFRDAIYAGIVFPYGVFVSSMFWGVYAINRELIFPKRLDGLFPAWLNHISHSIQVPTLLLEAVVVQHKYPSKNVGIATNAAFGVSYLLWTFYLAFDKDIWVYAFLQVLPWYGKAIYIAACLGVQIILYLVCEKVNYFWGFCPTAFDLKRLYGKKV